MGKSEKMKCFYFFVFSLLVLLSFACSKNERSEFDFFCDAFGNLANRNNFDEMTPVERNEYLMAEINSKLGPKSNAVVSWMAISSADASMRYELFKDAAASVSLKNWMCRAMEKNASKVGAF